MHVSLQGVRFNDDVSIGPVQRALILKTFPGFAALAAGELAVMAATSHERFFPAGATLLSPGVPVGAFYLIVDGCAQVFRQGRAQDMGPRSSVGGLAALARDPNGAHVVAIEDTVALEIDIEDMNDVFEDHFNILLGVLGAIGRTMRALQIQQGGGAARPARSQLGSVSERPLGLVDKMFVLKGSTSFADTSIEALADLARGATERRLAAGAEIWREGDRAEGPVLVVNGAVECQPSSGTPFELGPSYVVGGLDSIAQEPRWYRAAAKTDLRILELERRHLLDVLEDHPDVAMELLRGLARGVSAMLDGVAAREAAAERKSQRPPSDETA